MKKTQFAHFSSATKGARAQGAPTSGRPAASKLQSAPATSTSKPLCLCTLRRKGGF